MQVDGGPRYMLAVVGPVPAAAAWGIFCIPGVDPSASRPPIAIPDWLRLILETIFSMAQFGHQRCS